MDKIYQISYRNTITLKSGWLLLKNPCLILPWRKIFIILDHGILIYSDIEIDMTTYNNHECNDNSSKIQNNKVSMLC